MEFRRVLFRSNASIIDEDVNRRGAAGNIPGSRFYALLRAEIMRQKRRLARSFQPIHERRTRFRATTADQHIRTRPHQRPRSEEHTSELQSLKLRSYAAFCLKKKTHTNTHKHPEL